MPHTNTQVEQASTRKSEPKVTKTARAFKNKAPKQDVYRPLEMLSFAFLLLSIVGLIVTPASLLAAGAFALVATLLGFGGLSKFAKRPNEFKGEGLAIAGICIATLTFAIILVDLLL
jgi:hypothetical protein